MMTCGDFDYMGQECCPECHADPETGLYEVKIDGELALLCCWLVRFFYPNEDLRPSNPKLTPEEKLLQAIFGEHARHPNPNE